MRKIKQYGRVPFVFLSLLLGIFIVLIAVDLALAQSPLGIGVSEQRVDPASPFAFIFLQIQAWQQNFARIIQHTLIMMRDSGTGAWWLIGLSLIYGVLHAAGPGHGKAVISSYLLADKLSVGASLGRGVILSFFSSLLQALSAIVIVLVIFFLWPAKLTLTANFIVTLSFALVMCLGVWMLAARILNLWRRKKQTLHAIFDDVKLEAVSMMEPAALVPTAAVGECSFVSSAIATKSASKLAPKSDMGAGSDYRDSLMQQGHRRFRQLCADCGKMHVMVAQASHDKFAWRTVLPLVLATGLRPCAGALTVMSFALLNDLYIIGALSVFAMSLGTFVTVAALASLAVYAKKIALIVTAQKASRQSLVKEVIEWGACLFIFITGTLLFFSSFY